MLATKEIPIAAKVENLSLRKKSRGIAVDESVRACINCAYYEQYYRRTRGNIYGWSGTHTGYCLIHDCQRGALRQSCKFFERRENENN